MEWVIYLFILIVISVVIGVYYFVNSNIPQFKPYVKDDTLTLTWTASPCDCSPQIPSCDKCGTIPDYVAGNDLDGISINIGTDNQSVTVFSNYYTKLIVLQANFLNDQGVVISNIILNSTSKTEEHPKSFILFSNAVENGKEINETFSDPNKYFLMGQTFAPNFSLIGNSSLKVVFKFIE